MRGIKSQAMVLAASNSDHTKVELVEPPQGAVVGERVTFPGIEGLPDDVLNPKKNFKWICIVTRIWWLAIKICHLQPQQVSARFRPSLKVQSDRLIFSSTFRDFDLLILKNVQLLKIVKNTSVYLSD